MLCHIVYGCEVSGKYASSSVKVGHAVTKLEDFPLEYGGAESSETLVRNYQPTRRHTPQCHDLDTSMRTLNVIYVWCWDNKLFCIS
jgi:hypothetical protein